MTHQQYKGFHGRESVIISWITKNKWFIITHLFPHINTLFSQKSSIFKVTFTKVGLRMDELSLHYLRALEFSIIIPLVPAVIIIKIFNKNYCQVWQPIFLLLSSIGWVVKFSIALFFLWQLSVAIYYFCCIFSGPNYITASICQLNCRVSTAYNANGSNFEIESLFTLGECEGSQNIWLKPACIVGTFLFVWFIKGTMFSCLVLFCPCPPARSKYYIIIFLKFHITISLKVIIRNH